MSSKPNDVPDEGEQTTRRLTRRGVLAGTATLSSVSLLGSAGGSLAGLGDSASVTNQQPKKEKQEQNPDVAGLNYALTLEHLEYAFYRDGLKAFSDDELMGAKSLDSFGETVRMEVPEYLAEIRDNEKAHVDAITKTVKKLGGDPVGEAEYDFGYKTPSEFLKTGKALENTGVAAYAGAAPGIVNESVLEAALSIHTVEARHASFLNLINSSSPFPRAFDEAKSMDEVLKIAGKFIKSKKKDKKSKGKKKQQNGKMPTPDRKKDDDTSDLDVLNYALTLEHLEYAFYRDGLKKFNDKELENAIVCRFGENEVTGSVRKRLAEIRDHEKAHVDTITKTVKKLDGEPVSEAEYDFGYETASEFLGVAKALENTGVAAYLGVAPTVSSDKVFKAAASIQSVEARHASFLNELNGELPFPKAFDEAKSMDEVKKIAGQFIVSN